MSIHSATNNDDNDGGVLSAIGHEFDVHTFTYTSRDVILYALGGKESCTHTQLCWSWYSYIVGATLSPDNQSELKFLYEGDEDFSVLPSFGVIPAQVAWDTCMIHLHYLSFSKY